MTKMNGRDCWTGGTSPDKKHTVSSRWCLVLNKTPCRVNIARIYLQERSGLVPLLLSQESRSGLLL